MTLSEATAELCVEDLADDQVNDWHLVGCGVTQRRRTG